MLFRHFLKTIVGAILLGVTLLPSYAQEKSGVEPEWRVDPEAVQLMKKMTDFLVKLDQFSVRGEASREEVLHSGQKLMLHNQFKVEVRRPNKLHWTRSNADKDQELFYDGENITLHGKARKVYATTKAPPTIDEALDFTADRLNISASARDLIYEDVYDNLMSEVYAGSYDGEDIIDGVRCDHLAFRSEESDWQIWIEKGDKPLPRKFVITSRWLAGAPNYSARFIRWDLSVKLPDKRFEFVPPEGVSRIRFISEPPGSAKKGNKVKKEPSS